LVISPSLWQDADMDKEEIIARLRQHESELKAAGIVRLALFGCQRRRNAGIGCRSHGGV
jgi:hypothetical protein